MSIPSVTIATDPAVAAGLARAHGVLRLRRAVAHESMARCRERVWQTCADAVAATGRPPASAVAPPLLKRLAAEPAFAFVESPLLCAVLGQLLPGGWGVARTGGSFFAGGPCGTASPWRPPVGSWHWDGRPDLIDLPNRWSMFTTIEPLAGRAGGTSLIAGSHHRLRQFFDHLSPAGRSRPSRLQKREFTRREAWFRALNSEDAQSQTIVDAMAAGTYAVDGRPLSIVDVSGEPGDVVLVNGMTIHSSPTYIGPGPRVIHICVAFPQSVPVAVP